MPFKPFTVDSSNVFGISVQEAGTYNVKVTKAEIGTTGRGDDKLTLDYEVLDGEYAGALIRYHTLTWLDRDAEAEKLSETRFNTFMVAIGVKDGGVVKTLSQIANAAVGKQLTIDVDWSDPSTGYKSRLEVRGQHPLSSEPSKPNGVRKPDSNAAKGAVMSGAKSDPFASKGDTVNISDDDLPF